MYSALEWLSMQCLAAIMVIRQIIPASPGGGDAGPFAEGKVDPLSAAAAAWRASGAG